jgi:hypothetical protein
MNPQTLQSLAALFAAMAAFLGGMYLVMTRPLARALEDISDWLKRIETRLERIDGRLTELEKRVEGLEIKAWR